MITMIKNAVLLLTVAVGMAGAAEVAWQTKAGALFGVAGGDVLYVFDRDSGLVKMAVAKGNVLSRVPTGFAAVNQPLLNRGTLYVVGDDACLYALDAKSGARLWKSSLGVNLPSDMVLANDQLYFACGKEGSTLFGISLKDGKALFTLQLPGRFMSAPTVSGNTLYAGNTNGMLYSADLTTGMLLDSLQTEGAFYTQNALAMGNGLLLAPTGVERRLRFLSREKLLSTPALWSVSTKRTFYPDADELIKISLMRPVERDQMLGRYLSRARVNGLVDTAFLPAGPVHTSGWAVDNGRTAILLKEPDCFARAFYKLLLLDPATGTPVSKNSVIREDIPFEFCASPVFHGQDVLTLTGMGTVSGIQAVSGEQLWSISTGYELKGPLMVSENRVSALSRNGDVVTLALANLETGIREFRLESNRPNPFNPLTTIQYQLPMRCKAVLKLYNIRGQQVVALVNETQAPGVYKVRWNGTDANNRPVAAGVYTAVFRAGKYAKSIRMSLVK